jgi:hypothetical protein
VILLLDSLDDQRNLFNPEANLRALVKVQLATLLHYRNIYWRNTFTNNRVMFGDECTKLFHAMATVSHRRNTISQILNDSGVWVQDHARKEALLWAAFKSRLGVTLDSIMLFDLENLIIIKDNLDHLVAPITREEIDSIVKRWPIDKAPGPDGFNGMFMKKCWHIIKVDFYKLCDDFFENQSSLEGINNSYIVLIPKKNNPETVYDFRPNSLMNLAPKFVTMILADRL